MIPENFVTLAARLDRALAAHGVEAGTQRSLAFAQTLEAARPRGMLELYWLARIAMLPDIEDLDAFHAAFLEGVNEFADPGLLRALVQSVPQTRPAPAPKKHERLAPPPTEEQAGEDEDAATFFAMASPEERFAARDFAEMDERERTQALRAMERLRVALELRLSRRRRSAARGDRLDVRATMRGAARTAGELMRRRKSARRLRLRPLVFLCDVSGSMAPYARALLQYARLAALARSGVRAFAFATELTELTGLARRSSGNAVMQAFGTALRDYGGGTRIGAALRAFNDRYAQRGAARGGTVVILSDGWERDDPHLVGSEMARLRRLTHKIVWVNPQKKHPAFEPLALGMAAALPSIDTLVAGHNLRSLDAVAEAIEDTLLGR